MMYYIRKNEVFALGSTRVIATEDIYIKDKEQGYFILNFWDSCSYEDIEVLPVTYIPYTNDKQLYELRKNNIILGETKEICLI